MDAKAAPSATNFAPRKIKISLTQTSTAAETSSPRAPFTFLALGYSNYGMATAALAAALLTTATAHFPATGTAALAATFSARSPKGVL